VKPVPQTTPVLTNSLGTVTHPEEPIIEPDLPIVDSHHHLWFRPAPFFDAEKVVMLAHIMAGGGRYRGIRAPES